MKRKTVFRIFYIVLIAFSLVFIVVGMMLSSTRYVCYNNSNETIRVEFITATGSTGNIELPPGEWLLLHSTKSLTKKVEKDVEVDVYQYFSAINIYNSDSLLCSGVKNFTWLYASQPRLNEYTLQWR